MSPDELTDTFGAWHVEYVVFQTRYHDDLASVKALEERRPQEVLRGRSGSACELRQGLYGPIPPSIA